MLQFPKILLPMQLAHLGHSARLPNNPNYGTTANCTVERARRHGPTTCVLAWVSPSAFSSRDSFHSGTHSLSPQDE